MATIIITVTESETFLYSGIPEYITFATNVVATVFYTFDGTEPDTSSFVGAGNVYLPSNGLMVTLKAFATDGTTTTETLEIEYSTDSTGLNRTRLTGREGINILPAGRTPIDSLSFDEDGNDSQETYIDFDELDLITSTRNSRGEPIPDNSTLDFVRFAERTILEDNAYISNVNSINFDPLAKVIIVDAFTQEEADAQVVRVFNRPHDTLKVASSFIYNYSNSYPLVTSNFVRSFVNTDTGKMVSYYVDSRENRWLKSTQRIEDDISLNLTMKMSGPTRLIFRWIDDRTQSLFF